MARARRPGCAGTRGALAAGPASAAPPAPGDALYVPKPDKGADRQIDDLISQGDKAAADLIRAMIETPQAVWFTAGTPRSVRQDVRSIVSRAKDRGSVPVLVAYNIPFRDCAQFSAGGATTRTEYEEWIDGFAAGVGNNRAIVILEPDGLGIIPWYDPDGSADGSNALEWCQPAEADPATAAADRFAMLNHAVDVLTGLPNATVYLDGTHSAWLGVGDIAHRLARRASSTPEPTKPGALLGEWTGVALSSFGEWSDGSDDSALNTSGINLRYGNMLGGAEPATSYVIDTSRNGKGPWQPPRPPGAYPDAQDWCNPPDRGLGVEPTLDTGVVLVAAYLWIKIPGESDGECSRGLGPAGETVDPEWGVIDPAAGDWFPEMALELAANANPPLRP